jgi:hypothetical protein
MQVQAPSQALSQVPSYDGYLLYLQYNLLVDSNFNAINIFALGKQQGLDPGVLHGVVRPEDAFNYQQEGVVASGSGLLVLDSFESTLKFNNPMNGGATEKVLVKVIIVNRNTEVECDKGSHPTAADIQKSGTCTGQTEDSHHQATIILRNPANKNGGAGYYLLLARLYTWEIKLSKKGANALYDHLQSGALRGVDWGVWWKSPGQQEPSHIFASSRKLSKEGQGQGHQVGSSWKHLELFLCVAIQKGSYCCPSFLLPTPERRKHVFDYSRYCGLSVPSDIC